MKDIFSSWYKINPEDEHAVRRNYSEVIPPGL